MGQKMQNWVAQYRHMDWAVLYLRLFSGGLILFHNIGKIQNYNLLIESYPPMLYINPAAVFVVVTFVEVFFSVLIMIGVRVRLSACIMALGMLRVISTEGFVTGEWAFILMAIYVFLIISGGGAYSFDPLHRASTVQKQAN
ncbi:MAG: DoxX family membrane protein [Alistipes sp.]